MTIRLVKDTIFHKVVRSMIAMKLSTSLEIMNIYSILISNSSLFRLT